MILQESVVSTALNQEGHPRSRHHLHSSTLKVSPHPGQLGDQSPDFLEASSMQATLANPQCTLEPFSSQVLGAQVHAGTVHPQLSLDDAGAPQEEVQAVSFSRGWGYSTWPQEAPHPAWLTGSRCQEGDSGAGRGGREVLPRPINITVEHGSLKTHDWYWVAHSLHMPRHLFKPILVVLEKRINHIIFLVSCFRYKTNL